MSIKRIILIIFSVFFASKVNADIFATNCIVVEKKNLINKLSLVFSFNRQSIVFNNLNEKKIKYKINIDNILDKENLVFDASDEYYSLNFKSNLLYIKKNETKNAIEPKFKLINENLNSINIKCRRPKIIKKENLKIDNQANNNNQIDIKSILEQLKNNKDIDSKDLTKIIEKLNSDNASSKIDTSQLIDLLKSRSMIGQLTSKKTLDKLKSEDFIQIIKSEFDKLVNKK